MLDSSATFDAPDAAIFVRSAPPWNSCAPSPRVELLGRLDYADGVRARSLERVTSGTRCWLVQRFNVDLALAFTEDGREVHVFGALVDNLDHVASCIAGPVPSFLRWLRGWPSLHASSVVVDGCVLAVAGVSGAGKSTTVAALASRGHRVFSDDVLGWRNESAQVLACPGPVRMKLWPDSLAALDMDPKPLPRVRTDLEKRLLHPPQAGFVDELPLKAVYLLRRDGDAAPGSIREMHGADAFVALKANCRDDAVLMPAMRARQFEALGDLARKVRVCEVRAHSGLARIRDFADELAADFRRLPVAAT